MDDGLLDPIETQLRQYLWQAQPTHGRQSDLLHAHRAGMSQLQGFYIDLHKIFRVAAFPNLCGRGSQQAGSQMLGVPFNRCGYG